MTQHTELIAWLRTIRSPYAGASANALEAQAREIAELKAQEAELCTLYGMAEAECKMLRKDAERYAWLREALADRTGNGKSHWFCCIADGRPEELDAAIDEVIFQKGQP